MSFVIRRKTTYVGLVLFLCIGRWFLRGLTWQGGPELHTIMEAIATLLALMVGTLALLRFYSKKNNTFLFIGSGFIGSGLLDGYHTLVTT